MQILHRILVRGDQVALEPRCQLLTTQQLITPILSVVAIPVSIIIPARIVAIAVVGGASSSAAAAAVAAATILVVLVVAIAIVGSTAATLVAIPVVPIAAIVVLAIVAIPISAIRAGGEPETKIIILIGK